MSIALFPYLVIYSPRSQLTGKVLSFPGFASLYKVALGS